MIMKIRYFTSPILKRIDNEIRTRNICRLICLGCSPGFPLIYKEFAGKGLSEIQVVDNDIQKQGWKVCCDENDKNGKKIIETLPVSAINDTKDTLYICANTHYKDFVNQLSYYEIAENRIMDLNSIQLQWMQENTKEETSGYRLIKGRELQLEELKILKWFRDFCTDNNLRWFLGEGTLLGAVRHKGFIPWDDDIDTFMPYEDYVRCMEILPKKGKYHVIDWRSNPEYPFQFAKIIEDDTLQLHPIPFGYFTLGCYIDIFPIAGFPEDEKAIQVKYLRNKRLDFEWDRALIEADYSGECSFGKREEITAEKYSIPFDEAHKVGTMQQIAGNAWAIPREHFMEKEYLPFEDDSFPVPIGYKEFLTARYGNYMKLPPKEKRRIHSYPTYVITETDFTK